MSALMNIYIKRDTLAIMLDTLKKKDEKGISLTLSVNDKNDNYGHNVAAFVSQTKEDRESGKPRYYVGNGSVLYVSENGVKVMPKEQPQENIKERDANVTTEDLPF